MRVLYEGNYQMKKLLAALAITCATSVIAHAADLAPAPAPIAQKDWFVKAGVSGIFFEPALNNTVILGPASFLAPGATASIGSNVTGSLEIGRFVTNNIALTFEGGIPPSTTFTAGGTIAGLGNVASATYGFVGAGAEFHPIRNGLLDPYVDGGLAYNMIFSTSPSAAVSNLSIPNSFGGYVGAGLGMKVKDSVGVYVSAKQFFLSTNISANVAGVGPFSSNAQLNPFVVSAGLSYDF